MFPHSVILKDKVDKLSWLPQGAIWSLLFRASDDGKMAVNFHRCCDNKGPTVVLIKHGEFILGGYTSKSWKGGIYVWLILAQSFCHVYVSTELLDIIPECYVISLIQATLSYHLVAVSFKEYSEGFSKYLCSQVTYMLTIHCPRGLHLTSKIVWRQSKIYKSLLGSNGLKYNGVSQNLRYKTPSKLQKLRPKTLPESSKLRHKTLNLKN